jgi:hypothetical protein
MKEKNAIISLYLQHANTIIFNSEKNVILKCKNADLQIYVTILYGALLTFLK